MRISIICSLLLIFSSLAYAAQVPSHEQYNISASSIYDKETGIYEYQYEVYNPPANKNQIRRLIIYTNKEPDKRDLKWDKLQYGKGYSKYSSEANKDKIIAVGIDGPIGWTYGIGFDENNEGFIASGSLEGHEIDIGQSKAPLIMTSYGLPGLRKAEISPKIDYENLPGEYYGNVELSKKLRDALKFKTKTIGPIAPPKDLDPIAFLDGIIGMKHEAASLGWIKNKGVEISLDAKLENARKKIEQGNIKAAKNILGAFINEVEAQGCESYADCPGGKHLKPEAYALLKYNARYLIDNLK